MGGYGSGLYGGRKRRKITVEERWCIDIRRWQREKLLSLSYFNWKWTNQDGKTAGVISVIPKQDFLILLYLADGNPIKTQVFFESTKANFGLRKWFLCPTCNRRVAILYLNMEFFSCRKCCDLNYRSSQLSGDKVFYIDHQLRKILSKLNRRYEFDQLIPSRPKGMHMKTYTEICKQYFDLLEQREEAFIEGMIALNNRIKRQQH